MADLFGNSESSNLQQVVSLSVESYFNALKNDEKSVNLYEIFLDQIEPPVFSSVLKYTRGNQSRAAKILGLSRGTLRKKLKRQGLIGPANERRAKSEVPA